MKTHEKIRAIATSHSGNRFAVAEYEDRVQVWDIEIGLIRIFNTEFDYGGKRISISNSGKYLTVGSYDSNNITTYSIDSGDIIWTRNDLKKCQRIHFAMTEDEAVFVELEGQLVYLISVENGEVIDKNTKVEHIWSGTNLSIIEGSTTLSLVNGERKIQNVVPKKTFAILDAYFTNSNFIVSFSAGPIEVMDLDKFNVKWTTETENEHYLSVGYNDIIDKVVAVNWNYNTGGSKKLCYLNYQNGLIENEVSIDDVIDASFLKNCNFIITSKGHLISVIDGKFVKRFDFESH